MADMDGLAFRWPWRDYQARVLGALEDHLHNDRLHVVAAPGSGKTVLGLEVFRRLARPTLVLSPTRTIRDQWLERLGDFLPEGGDPFALDWISRDLAEPRFFTSLTYQALHTRMRLEAAEATGADEGDLEAAEAGELEVEADGNGPSEDELGEVVRRLRAANVGVIILDEAHHLRAEWWVALQRIVEQLEDVRLVSLTATPPYDVVGREWNRYIELCGPIDEEISVPELVKAGTLCPHQDYLWLVRCEGDDAELLRRHRARVVALLNELSGDGMFLEDCRRHAWVQAPDAHLGELMDAPRQAMALAGVLHRHGRDAGALMAVIDVERADLQDLTEADWEHLLRLYLFGEGWPDEPELRERRQRLARKLRADNLLWRRELALADAGRQWPRLSLGAAKADACLELHRLECEVRGDALRQVILTDYIRDEEYARPIQPALSLGAWPVFFRLAGGASACRLSALALHTGRLSIVHRSLVDELQALPDCPPLQVLDVPSLADFVQVRSVGGQRLTRVLTRLLVAGRVQVLVGTRALLGEGWDAPPVNSLVLASVVGSFMTTNQMRGRAIRVDPARADKVASIWHIGAFAQIDAHQWDLRDLRDMHQRFETFVGLAHKRPVIEGGLARLRPGFMRGTRYTLPIDERALNRRMARRLRDTDAVARGWRDAVDHSDIGQVLPTVKVPKPPRFRPLDFHGTLATLLWQLAGVSLMVLAVVMEPGLRVGTPLPTLLALAAIAVLVVTGPRAFRVARLFLRYLPVDGAIRGISLAVRDALCEAGLLPAALKYARVIVSDAGAGQFHIALSIGSLAERSLFADCVAQALGPIERPRYLVTRRQARRVGRTEDVHAVPAVLGSRAERAQAFLRAWHRHVGPGELLYTRGDEGRHVLAKARFRAFSAAADDAVRRMDRWF